MSTVRERRLRSDGERLNAYIAQNRSQVAIEQARGTPAETFILSFKVPSIVRVEQGKPVVREQHRMKVELPADYPALPPLVTVLDPIFHPHVWPRNNVVCLGSWTITESLDQLVTRLHSMLVYQPAQLNWKSVANNEAAVWASRNTHLFPLRQEESRQGLSGTAWLYSERRSERA
jgi:ubiquitin-protein ligase